MRIHSRQSGHPYPLAVTIRGKDTVTRVGVLRRARTFQAVSTAFSGLTAEFTQFRRDIIIENRKETYQ